MKLSKQMEGYYLSIISRPSQRDLRNLLKPEYFGFDHGLQNFKLNRSQNLCGSVTIGSHHNARVSTKVFMEVQN